MGAEKLAFKYRWLFYTGDLLDRFDTIWAETWHYENMPIQIYRKFHHQKRSDKNSDSFHISAQNIDCWYSLELPQRGSSNEYLQSVFLSRNKKNNIYPSKPQFSHIKVGFKGVNIYKHIFVIYTYFSFMGAENLPLFNTCVL